MQMLHADQRGKLFTWLEKEDVTKFWSILDKDRRMDSFDTFDGAFKFDFMVGEFLDESQKHRLWDNIGQQKRLAMWKSARNAEIVPDCVKEYSKKQRVQKLQSLLLKQLTVH